MSVSNKINDILNNMEYGGSKLISKDAINPPTTKALQDFEAVGGKKGKKKRKVICGGVVNRDDILSAEVKLKSGAIRRLNKKELDALAESLFPIKKIFDMIPMKKVKLKRKESAWIKHIKKVQAESNGKLSYKEAMKEASKTYVKKGKVAKKVEVKEVKKAIKKLDKVEKVVKKEIIKKVKKVKKEKMSKKEEKEIIKNVGDYFDEKLKEVKKSPKRLQSFLIQDIPIAKEVKKVELDIFGKPVVHSKESIAFSKQQEEDLMKTLKKIKKIRKALDMGVFSDNKQEWNNLALELEKLEDSVFDEDELDEIKEKRDQTGKWSV